MRIDNIIYKNMEHELYNYEQTKRNIKLYRESIIESTPVGSETKDKYTISDSTGSKAIKLTTSAFLFNAEMTIDAIDKALKQLSKNHNVLFDLHFLQCMRWYEVYLEMNISKRQFYKLKRELIIQVAINLGKVNPDC